MDAPAYTLGRHPRRPDHPALLNPDGTAAHTFHIEATRTEIAAILAARGLALHADGSVTQAAAEVSATRRGLLAGLVGAAATLAVIAPPAVRAASHPDAELLEALAHFDDLERRINLTYQPVAETFEAEDAQEALRDPLREQQKPLLERICVLCARTPDGWLARAQTLLLWDNEMPAAIENGAEKAEYYEDRMIIALIRDMTQVGAA